MGCKNELIALLGIIIFWTRSCGVTFVAHLNLTHNLKLEMEAVTFLRNQLDGVQQELSDLIAEVRAGELSLEMYNGLSKPIFARVSELEDKIQKALQTPSSSTTVPAP